jgi:hypothetical protein
MMELCELLLEGATLVPDKKREAITSVSDPDTHWIQEF